MKSIQLSFWEKISIGAIVTTCLLPLVPYALTGFGS